MKKVGLLFQVFQQTVEARAFYVRLAAVQKFFAGNVQVRVIHDVCLYSLVECLEAGKFQ